MISYAGREFLTGDDIAFALLELSRALGQEDTAEIVEIPIRDHDGLQLTAKFLIGPASQIVVTSVRDDPRGMEELTDTGLIARLRASTRDVSFPRGTHVEPGSVGLDALEH